MTEAWMQARVGEAPSTLGSCSLRVRSLISVSILSLANNLKRGSVYMDGSIRAAEPCIKVGVQKIPNQSACQSKLILYQSMFQGLDVERQPRLQR